MIGRKLTHFEVTAKLGQGGMGEVWRAEDTKLGRQVAIKVLPEAVAEDPERLARFEREARVLASLNHPNIAAIYEVGEGDGEPSMRFLVMELVEGPTLDEHLAKGRMPFEEVLSVALQIAEALEEAHERGIVHRDLKPANVKVRVGEGGAPIVKILDFGLAKVQAGAIEEDARGGLDDSQTLTLAATQVGLILGTAAYMSPEQAKGHPADRRADIWSFGVLLHEMLSGKMLFDAETISEVLAAVLRKELDWNRLPSETPAPIRHLLRRCLVRDPRSRLRDIGEARVLIEEVLVGSETDSSILDASGSLGPNLGVEPRRLSTAGGKLRLAWAVALGAIVSGLGTWVALTALRAPPSPVANATREPITFELALPPELTLGVTAEVSPDGRKVAFAGQTSAEGQMIWLRALDSFEPRPVPKTEGANEFFWSPDSNSLGFFSAGRLRLIELASGFVTDLAAAPEAYGGSWNRDGVIIFGAGTTIQRVDASGGRPTAVTSLDPEREEDHHLWPRFLPDGRHFTFLADELTDTHSALWVSSIDDPTRHLVLESAVHAVFMPPEFLLFPSSEGRVGFELVAQPFDLERLELHGERRAMVGRLPARRPHRFGLSASPTGTLVYQTGSPEAGTRRLAWFDSSGGNESVSAELEVAPVWFDLSSDDQRLLVGTATGEIWVVDLSGPSARRLTLPGSAERVTPVWSPSGDRIAYLSFGDLEEVRILDLKTGEERSLLSRSGQEFYLHDWSRDGRWLIAEAGDGIYALPTTGDGPPRHIVEWADEIESPSLSPDGRFVAYARDADGRRHVFVAPFEDNAVGVLVSKEPGRQPRWSPDGETLYFLSSDSELMAVEVDVGATISAGTARPLFRIPTPIRFDELVSGNYYEVSSDGSRFLLRLRSDAMPDRMIRVTTNWPAAQGASGRP